MLPIPLSPNQEGVPPDVASVEVVVGSTQLNARLTAPAHRVGWAVLGSSVRWRPETAILHALHNAGFATMQVDLLQMQERPLGPSALSAMTLTERLVLATHWLAGERNREQLPVGYVGLYGDAALHLHAAVLAPEHVKALVLWQGNPLAVHHILSMVQAPALLLVNGADSELVEKNVQAYWQMGGLGQVAVLPRAASLLRERASLWTVAHLAVRWLQRHLQGKRPLKEMDNQLFGLVSGLPAWGGHRLL